MKQKFKPIDPLDAKQSANTEVAVNALKKEIENILSCYCDWFDPFSELIQNSLDSIEERQQLQENDFIPKLRILINIQENQLTVTDNGIGLSQKQFKQFLAPNFSFKSGKKYRGHKGVGATYLAYAFNFIQICTKAEDFETIGQMKGAKRWLSDENPSGNPEILYDSSDSIDREFDDFDSGVSITIRFDKTTRPADLNWIGADTANKWKYLLLVKTGLGAFEPNKHINVFLQVKNKKGNVDSIKFKGVEYYWPHQIDFLRKTFQFSKLKSETDQMTAKKGPHFQPPSKLRKIECIYDWFNTTQIIEYLYPKESDAEEKKLVEKFQPSVYFAYMYSAKVWSLFNKQLEIRQRKSVLSYGVQICADNMPQGEVKPIQLQKNTGRERMMLMVVYFKNCKVDMGRKGFHVEVTNVSGRLAQKIIEGLISKYLTYLKPSTGTNLDLKREKQIEEWKQEMKQHMEKSPLKISNPNFFNPTNSVSILSEPTREQDVIALFNQLLAGGVIRGIRIMSTNERFTYDGMYRIWYQEPDTNHLFDEETNPLGVTKEYLEIFSNYRSEPRILEYKFTLDGLIEDIETGTKNTNDIDLVVVWETGSDYDSNYSILSLLVPDNCSQREYHGVTHQIQDAHGHKVMDLIVLKELVGYLNDRETEIENQEEKYY